jgi:microcin C transport system substrate-binding protein
MRLPKNKMRLFFLFVILISCITLAFTLQAAAPKNEPVSDPRAVRGGELILHSSDFPKSFNYMVNNASDAAMVFGLVYDTLMEIHPTTLDFMPLIAKSWEISPDKKVFTLKIDPRAKWDDGKPITAEDVKFTYDTIMNPKNLTSVHRMSLSRFETPVVIDQSTIKFTAKTVHYNNLVTLAGLYVLPKHLFSGKDFNKSFNMSLPPGSGPYVLSEVREGRYYVLKRRQNYWADQLPNHRGTYNFESIKYKVMSETVVYEAFKKGDFDILDDGGISAKRWATETDSKPFQKNWIVKQKVYNYAPQGFQGLAFNMRRPVFQDIRVREAICHLIDQKYLLEKIMFNQYQQLNSYWPSLYGSTQANPPIRYDPVQAKQLLKEAGYDRLDKNGYLINQKGERLEFTLIYQGETLEKHLTYFAETCKKAGVKVNLQILSWATLIKKMDEYSFDMVFINWGQSLFDDPEQLWHSKHISETGGSNITGYKNGAVDKLIDSMPPIFDAAKRIQIIKQIDHMIYQEYPYVLLWGRSYIRVMYKNVFGMPKTIFTKYGDNQPIPYVIAYWWFDQAKLRRYQEAVKKNQALPRELEEVYYDQIANQK